MHGINSIQRAEMLPGVRGTRQTLQAMAALVRKDASDMHVRAIAESIVASCPGHQFECEIDALFTYCRDSITYRRDPVEQERIQDTLRTARVFGTGDCDDKCVCLAGLLGALGHKSRFVIIGSKDKYSHVYLETWTNDGWLPLDPTPEQAPAGWEARASQRDTYEIWPTAASPLWLVAAGIAAYYFLR